MSLPQTAFPPPFQVTRASHAVIAVSDLAKSRAFYVDGIGLVASDETRDAIYLRGVEEAAHHSLVLKRASGAPVAERVGLRVYTEEDLDRAKAHFAMYGRRPRCKGNLTSERIVRVQPCIRPLNAAVWPLALM